MSAFSKARFLVSAARPEDLPPEAGPELAFAGRSNVGKSSAINALAGRKRLAFISRTPGRTRTINFYALGDAGRLADLPGYGYAKAPREERAGWDLLIGSYLAQRRSLFAVVVLMDARRPLTPVDREFLEWLKPFGVRTLVLLSKADKLPRAARAAALAATNRALRETPGVADVQLFSAKEAEVVRAVRELLERWLREARSENKKPPA